MKRKIISILLILSIILSFTGCKKKVSKKNEVKASSWEDDMVWMNNNTEETINISQGNNEGQDDDERPVQDDSSQNDDGYEYNIIYLDDEEIKEIGIKAESVKKDLDEAPHYTPSELFEGSRYQIEPGCEWDAAYYKQEPGEEGFGEIPWMRIRYNEEIKGYEDNNGQPLSEHYLDLINSFFNDNGNGYEKKIDVTMTTQMEGIPGYRYTIYPKDKGDANSVAVSFYIQGSHVFGIVKTEAYDDCIKREMYYFPESKHGGLFSQTENNSSNNKSIENSSSAQKVNKTDKEKAEETWKLLTENDPEFKNMMEEMFKEMRKQDKYKNLSDSEMLIAFSEEHGESIDELYKEVFNVKNKSSKDVSITEDDIDTAKEYLSVLKETDSDSYQKLIDTLDAKKKNSDKLKNLSYEETFATIAKQNGANMKEELDSLKELSKHSDRKMSIISVKDDDPATSITNGMFFMDGQNIVYIGSAYYVSVREADNIVVEDFSDTPLQLKLSYTDEVLKVAKERANLTDEEIQTMDIYKFVPYKESIPLNGKYDSKNKCVTKTITESGQYYLGVKKLN